MTTTRLTDPQRRLRDAAAGRYHGRITAGGNPFHRIASRADRIQQEIDALFGQSAQRLAAFDSEHRFDDVA